MERRILVNIEPRETRMAVLEDGLLVELRIEQEQQEVGSIYKGKIDRVLPGMDSCFVDIGLDRNAFMHVKDFAEAEEEAHKVAAAAMAHRSKGGKGGHRVHRGRPNERHYPPITDVAHDGEALLVQVARGSLGHKGARATTRISLPGRWVVLLPVSSSHVGVSRKIADDRERGRLKELGNQLKPRGYGLIIRTEAAGCTLEDLEADVEQLKKEWRSIKSAFRRKKAPALLREELSLVERMVRDRYSEETREIIVDCPEAHKKAVNALRAISKEAASRCKLYQGKVPLFESFGVEAEISRVLRRRVDLPSGSNLTIDENEAMSTIDVNTGRFIGTTNLQDTVVATNLEAAREIARQLRVRDIGGIIILDFIDMVDASHRKQVMKELEEHLTRDRARTRIVHISPLGLIEMTRKRTGLSLLHSLCEVCPHCRGQGRVLSPESLASRIERDLRRRRNKARPEAFALSVPFEVAWEMIGPEGGRVAHLEELLEAELYIRCDPLLQNDQYQVHHGRAADIAADYHPFRLGQMYHCRPREVRLGDDGEAVVAEVEGYIVLLDELSGERNGLVTVELTDVNRSLARGRLVK